MAQNTFPSNASNAGGSVYGPTAPRNSLILCFDGTGNKFQGNTGDSNIIKIFSMLDRQSPYTHSYYQPGIGTYIEDSALSKTSHLARIRSAYMKAKDSAVGTSFDTHVMAGYEFIMKHYGTDDDLYFFGFSRGAYIARFLAQMLDAVGLLSRGNEEMLRFAWKAFSQWQTRLDETEEQKKQKEKTFKFMQAFRETFSRPVRRIRFMGLFDTVNSVPRFETAWMSRSRFPYTARSSAKIVRHAVAIDERRAKFRQNLISQKVEVEEDQSHHHHHLHDHHDHHDHHEHKPQHPQTNRTRGPTKKQRKPATSSEPGRYRPRKNALCVPSSNMLSRKPSQTSINSTDLVEARTKDPMIDDDDEDTPQDVQEIWFPGCHADIGGGWPLDPGMDAGLSHAPLLWIVREATRAGIPFEPQALEKSGYHILSDFPTDDFASSTARPSADIPSIRIQAGDDADLPSSISPSTRLEPTGDGTASGMASATASATNLDAMEEQSPAFKRATAFQILHTASTRATIHDSLAFKCGTPAAGVLTWRMMEYLPFRRMDLRSDGTWAPIRWPLPCGETRDIPDEAWIHHTALRRMEADKKYRPGNLIVGGGGRGVRKAGEEYGMGEWQVHREKGHPVGECVVRVGKGGLTRVNTAKSMAGG